MMTLDQALVVADAIQSALQASDGMWRLQYTPGKSGGGMLELMARHGVKCCRFKTPLDRDIFAALADNELPDVRALLGVIISQNKNGQLLHLQLTLNRVAHGVRVRLRLSRTETAAELVDFDVAAIDDYELDVRVSVMGVTGYDFETVLLLSALFSTAVLDDIKQKGGVAAPPSGISSSPSGTSWRNRPPLL